VANDEFSKASGDFLEKAATGSVGLAAAALVDPAAGVLATATVGTAFAWFRRRAARHDGPFDPALIADVGDEFKRVDAAVEGLRARLEAVEKKVDRQDSLSQERIFSEFADSVVGARTPEKRTALVHATARQFDPTAGEPSVRAYWMRRVSDMPDLEIRFVQLLGEHGMLAFKDGAFKVSRTARRYEGVVLPSFTNADVVALELCALAMSEGKDLSNLVARARDNLYLGDDGFTAHIFGLSSSGAALASFIAP
jgi:hypothetical protein